MKSDGHCSIALGGHTTHGEEGETRVNTSAHMSRAWADPVDDLSASWESDIQQVCSVSRRVSCDKTTWSYCDIRGTTSREIK